MLAVHHDAFDVITLVLAIFGSLVGVAALVWQGVTWSLSGSRVKATLSAGGLGPGGAVIAPVKGPLGFQLPDYAPIPVMAVPARNAGRTAVTVERYMVRLPDGVRLWAPPLRGSDPIPHRLEPGTSGTWYVELELVRASVHAMSKPVALAFIEVELGDGSTVRTKEQMNVPATH